MIYYYIYIRFNFSKLNNNVSVKSQLLKDKKPATSITTSTTNSTSNSTKELWFSASFDLTRSDFTVKNLLYTMLKYPLHTRVIQLWIHIEAIKLWCKGH